MAEQRQGYRAHRLAQRRAEKSRSWQSGTLYVLAAAVACTAVIGSVYLARRLTARHIAVTDASFIALVRVGTGEKGAQPMSALLLYDRPKESYTLFTIPRSTLLVGLRDEYLLAGDMASQPEYEALLGKLVKAAVQHQLSLSFADLEQAAGTGRLGVKRAGPA